LAAPPDRILDSVAVQLEQVAAALPSYEIGEEIGRGSTGVVLAARHRRLGREVAVKMLPRHLAEDESVRRRFVAEAQLLASFSHVHIVPIYDFVEEDGLCLLVMERLGGGTLGDYARAGIDGAAGCAAMLAVCSALQYAHERGVLHRDIKPTNVVVADDGLVKVTDFGIAKVLGGAESMATRTGLVVGTPNYMAPEQADGTVELTPATDVYGAGTMLYELLAGRLPFPSEGAPLHVLYTRVHTEPDPLDRVAPDVPNELAAVVMRAIEREPARRQASADELSDELSAAAASAWGPDWLRGTPFQVSTPAGRAPSPTLVDRPPTLVDRPPAVEARPAALEDRPPAVEAGRRSRMPIVVAALLALAAAGGVIALATGGGGDGEPAPPPQAAPPARPSQWRDLANLDPARQQAPATVLDKIVMPGGLIGEGDSLKATNTVATYDPGIGSWDKDPPLPRPLHHAMAVTYEGHVVVMGGWVPEGPELTAETSNRVYQLNGDRWEPLPNMRSPRAAGAAAVVGDKLVVVGGQADGRLVPTTEIFDGERWTAGADMPTSREHLAAVSDKRFMYAIGGRDLKASANLKALERYDPETDEWTPLAPMPNALGGLGAARIGGTIAAVGGEDESEVFGALLLYDIGNDEWTRGEPMPEPRHGMGVVAVGNALYALGGSDRLGHRSSSNVAELLPFKEKG
jgi:non-specific serine/threonine protein kinase